MLGFNGKSIYVAVLGKGKQIEYVDCKVEEGKIYLNKDVFFNFKTEDVGTAWIRAKRPPFRHTWFECVLWREGSAYALPWGNPEDDMPPLTAEENASFIKQCVAHYLAKGGEIIKTWQFAVLLIAIIVVGVLVALNLFGVSFTATQTVHTVIATPTPTPALPTVHPLPTIRP
jgi:hypothetical protein